ncbi:MAG TPA: helix-turn-helix transcriptional regulator [Solirubrobacteraceae bacterium]|jgi:cytoskeletal protein RodZ|nr:helix-turn-helix transcriptional regulator [Solirubrobacteraceae bacterium]
MAEIGATLRETRMRARVDVSEIEAQTKIRAKYLRALENEEWDLLPGPTFVRSFLRTYAQALGLDDKALVDEYRRVYEQPSEVEHQPAVMASTSRRPRSAVVTRGPSRGYTIALGVVGLLIVLLVVGLLSEKKGGSSPKQLSSTSAFRNSKTPRHHSSSSHSSGTGTGNTTSGTLVALSLKPSGPVWVCLIGDGTRKAIPGVTLQPSYTPVTYHASRFTITLGNDEVTMYVNGRPESVPTTSNAIGYSITSSGRHLLSASQQPTCK